MNRARDAAAGLALGAAAGIVASLAMNRFQSVLSAVGEGVSDDTKDDASDKDGSPPATVVAADKVSRKVVGKAVAEPKKEAAGNLVHYVTGAALGAFYGAAAAVVPEVRAGAGMLYGAGVWLVLDEGLSPLLGLGESPDKVKPRDHLYALVSHLAFGVALDGAFRLLDRACADD